MNKKNRTLYPSSLQINHDGEFEHFLDIKGLSRNQIINILDLAESFIDRESGLIRTVPLLRGKTVVNLFFETSTRTRVTFELAAKRLSADVVNLNINTAAVQKGESLLDTLKNMQAMSANLFVVRHNDSGAAQFIARNVKKGVAVVNAGDGSHAHPTQALLDMLTIRKYKKDFANLSVAIIGDILHSRVARSQIIALKILGVKDIRLIAPKTLAPASMQQKHVNIFHNRDEGIKGCDVVIMLRLQKERMHGAFLPNENEYYKYYGLNSKSLALAADNSIVMHPGPINREVEISSLVADGEQSVILEQVTYGIAVRMAVMSLVASGQKSVKPRTN